MSEKISRDEVRHVARLARLEFSATQEDRLTEQMNSILGYMDKLNELDTAGLTPMSHATGLRNVFRDDAIGDSLKREQALDNAPADDGINFVVPKII
jgi:aspartyl-tRNA(Asn)/glutamyl-tRNA(Gln) amidotransferase subunit C